jgi:hypothetical protein
MEYLSEIYQDWDDTVRISLDCNQDSFLKLVEDFWEIFSKNLRILYYENIPNREILHWNSRLSSEEFPAYQTLLANERKQLLKIWNSNFIPNENTLNLVEKMKQTSFEGAMRGN